MASASNSAGGSNAKNSQQMTLAGQTLVLRGDGCALDPHSGTLFLTDVHLGKSETFQSRGLPVPIGNDNDTILKMQRAITETQAKTMVILGDLFHAPGSLRSERLENLIDQFNDAIAIPTILIKGNHDRFPPGIIAKIDAQIERDAYILSSSPPWGCYHHPPVDISPEHGNSPWLAGHLHPVVSIKAPGQRLRLRCFAVYAQGLVLPAFGPFTGGFLVKASASSTFPQRAERPQRTYAIWDNCILG